MARLNLPHVQHGVPAPHAELLHQRVDNLLETFLEHTRQTLRDCGGRKRAQKLARSYLQGRGVDLEDLDRLPVGLVIDAQEVHQVLSRAGFRPEEIEASKLIADSRLPGRLVGPIQDSDGRILSFWARHPEDVSPKYLFKGKWQNEAGVFGLHTALPALRHSDGNLVLVSDLLDAVLLSHQGFSRVAAIGGPAREMTSLRWQRLAEQGVHQVTLVLSIRRPVEILDALEAAFSAVRAPRLFVCVSERLRQADSVADWCHEQGLDALGELLAHRVHAYHFKALTLLDDYRPDGPWNDAARYAALDAARAFYDSRVHDDSVGDLDRHFVPPILEELRLDWDATPPVHEPDWEDVPEDDIEGEEIAVDVGPPVISEEHDAIRAVGAIAAEEPAPADEPYEVEFPGVVAEELPEHRDYLAYQQAHRLRGLPQRTLPALDRLLCGLRGLMLLGGPVGDAKTALSLQLGIDVVRHHPKTCLLFVSQTIFHWEVLTRLKARLAHLNAKRLLKAASSKTRRLSSSQRGRLERAEQQLADWGRRVLILDRENTPELTLERIREAWHHLKSETGSRRGVIVIDGLENLREGDAGGEPVTRESLLGLFEEEMAGNAVIATTAADLAASAAGTVLPCSQFPGMRLLKLSDPATPEMSLRGWTAAELAALFTGTPTAQPPTVADERRWRGELARHGWLLHKLEISDPRQPGLVAELDLPLQYRTWSFREGLPRWKFLAPLESERKPIPRPEVAPQPPLTLEPDRQADPKLPPAPPASRGRSHRHLPGQCTLHNCDNLDCFCFD